MTKELVPHREYEIINPRETANYKQVVRGTNIRWFSFMGLFVLISFGMGGFYWATNAELNGAIVAPASFVVEGNRKTVQHLEGGIVSELLVKDGDFVKANQVLMRMDRTDNDVNVDVLGSQFTELSIRKTRLLAQLNERGDFTFEDLKAINTASVGRGKIQSIFSTQKKLFDAQQRSIASEKDILEQRISSLKREIQGLEEQREANTRQLVIAKTELEAFTTLLKKGLTPASRVNSIKREIERLRGLDASFTTSQARAQNQIGELQLTALRQAKARRETATTELAAVETQLSEIEPRLVGALQKQKRIEVKAPVSGHVVNLSIYTKGGVIRPGERVLDIVPVNENLIIEARVNPTDIEKLSVGQSARVRLTAFDQTNIPEAVGVIVDVSADSITDEKSGADYFVARVKLDGKQPEAIAKLEFVPGMPADVFVNTGKRTAISYLMQPLNDRIARTFIE